MYDNFIKKIQPGKGQYLVTATINALVFKQVKQPLPLGLEVSGSINQMQLDIIDAHTLPFQNYQELQEFKALLVDSYETRIFQFKNVEFDFSEYNRQSIDCILDQVSWLESFIPKAQII